MKPNLAARAGRWSAAHWKTATFGWIGLVAVAAVLGMTAGTNKLTDDQQGTGETATAQQILADSGFRRPATESVLIQSKTLGASDPRFHAAVASVTDKLAARAEVTNLRSPYQAGAGGAVSKDGHSALVEFDMAGKADKAKDRVQPVLDAVAAAQEENPEFTIAQFGPASAQHALDNTIGKDFQQAEQLSLPIIFAILLVAFGAFVAAGVPLLLGFSAVLGAIGLSALISHVIPATDTTASVILLMGMAVGVDYALFYLKRQREERAAGHEDGVALQRAAATSGQAVLDLRRDRDDRDGGHDPGRLERLHLDRGGGDDRRVRRHGRLGDRAARGAGQAREPRRPRGAGGDRRRPGPARTADPAGSLSYLLGSSSGAPCCSG